MNLNQVTVPSLDLTKSIPFYENLGLKLIVKSLPHYARFVCQDGNSTFSIHKMEELPKGEGIYVYFECDNLDTYTDLIDYIQNLNRSWMDITNRLSPQILIDLVEYSENELYKFFSTLNPMDKAIFSVQWAGEEESENWFDIAREYTEKLAWIIFTNTDREKEAYKTIINIEGDEQLGYKLLDFVTVLS